MEAKIFAVVLDDSRLDVSPITPLGYFGIQSKKYSNVELDPRNGSCSPLSLVTPLGVLKIFWVSGVVTFTTVFLGSSVPVEQTRLHAVAWIHFVYICALMLPFEIYDNAHDPAELRTLPQRIGIPWTKRFGYFLGVVFVVLVFLNQDLHKLWAAISIAVLTVGAIYKTQPHQSKTFTAFWVEALPMVWAGLVYGFGG